MDNFYLIRQIVVALLQDGTIKMEGQEIADAIEAAVNELGGGYRFLGVATPDLAPGKILAPTLYVAVADATYPSFSGQSVDSGQIVFFYSDDGEYWDALVAYDAGGGGGASGGCVEYEMPENGFKPDIVYELGTITEDTQFFLNYEAQTDCGPNHWFIAFDTDGASPAPTITWPRRIIWKDGAAPEIVPNARYEISILMDCAIGIKFDL